MPSTKARPASGRISVVKTRTAVVLPAPFGPSTPTTLARSTRGRRRTALWSSRTASPGPRPAPRASIRARVSCVDTACDLPGSAGAPVGTDSATSHARRPCGPPTAEHSGFASVCSSLYTAAWRIERQSSGDPATRAPSCCACSPGHPEIEVVHVTADSQRGRARRRAVPVAGRRVRRASCYAPLEAGRPRRARRRVPRAAARAVAGASPAGARRHRRPRRRPRRRLPAAAPTSTSSWYGETAHGARAARPVRVRPRRALPRRHRRRARTSPRPVATRPRPQPRAGAAARAPGSSSRPASSPTRCRACRARAAALKATSLFSEANENVAGLRAAHASPHRGDGAWRSRTSAGAAGAGAVHAAPRADDAGHPRHLLRAARASTACQHRRACSSTTATFYDDEPFVVVVDEPPGTKATLGVERRARHRALRRAHRHRVAIGGEDNLVKGASGQAIQDANLCSACPRPPAPARRACHEGRERHRARRGSSPAGWRCGIKDVGRARPRASSPPPTTRRSPRPACSRPTSRRRRRCRSAARHLADGRAAAVVLNSGNANAATGEAGRRDALRMCELTARVVGLRDRRRARLLRPGSSASRCRWTRSRRGSRSSCGALSADAAAATRRPTRCSPPTPCARRPSQPIELRARRGRHRRRHGQGRGDAVAGDGHDARGAHHRRRRRARARCSSALARRGRRHVQLPQRRRLPSTNDTVLRARERARRQRADRHARAARTTRSATRSRRCAPTSREQMARDAEGATKFVRSTCAAPAPTPRRSIAARAVASSQLVQCSLYGSDPYWGRVLSELGASGALFDPEQVDIAYSGVTVCRDGIAARARRGRARRSSWRERDIDDRLRPARRARRGDRALHRPHPRVRRREHGHLVSDRRRASTRRADDEGRDPRRGAAVHPRVLGQDRRHQVRRPRDGRSRARRPVRAGRRAHAPRRA